MDKFESRIKEERLAQAVKKGFPGSGGKIGTIVKYLGEPIISHTEGAGLEGFAGDLMYFSSTPYEEDEGYSVTGSWGESFEIQTQQVRDVWGNPIVEPTGYGWSDKKPPRKDFNIEQIGWYFDGLSQGYHLYIRYLDTDKELLVQYKSNPVYQEVGSDLMMYVPGEWEAIIEKLYPKAAVLKKSKEEIDLQESKKESAKNKETWMATMLKKWGFNAGS